MTKNVSTSTIHCAHEPGARKTGSSVAEKEEASKEVRSDSGPPWSAASIMNLDLPVIKHHDRSDMRLRCSVGR
jgi:hypothetical protein